MVPALLAQDYVSGLFVDDALGAFPGTMTLSDINLKGSAVTPMPAIAVNFRTWSTGCDRPSTCVVEVADTVPAAGSGHARVVRPWRYLQLSGRRRARLPPGFIDVAPTSNADIGKTIAALLHLDIPDKGKLVGRVLTETMTGGVTPAFSSETIASAPDAQGMRTMVRRQRVGDTLYFDAAGSPGRTFGLE